MRMPRRIAANPTAVRTALGQPSSCRTFHLSLADGRRVSITNGDLADFAGVARRAVAQAGYALGGDGA